MGTKLGNLHILGASVDEVAPLLPGAIVGRWSEWFVSAYSEEYQLGSAEQAGKRLSRKLPGATVLSAAIFDSDMVSFEIYQAGKRLTAHLLNPYEDINRLGDPKVFCEALGLPAEDEKRLKVLWKKGDAEEQLELTAALLDAPLYFDPEFLPKEPVGRDAGKVDAWIAERPDPPKIKSVTKAELVQEIPGVDLAAMPGYNRKIHGSKDYFLALVPVGEEQPHFTAEIIQLWAPKADGTLHCVAETPPINWPEVSVRFFYSQKRILIANTKLHYEPDPNWPAIRSGKPDGTYIIFDSAGRLPLPFCVSEDQSECIPTPDGGVWAVIQRYDHSTVLRYAPNGALALEKALGPDEHVVTMTGERIYTRRSEPSSDRKQPSWFRFFCYDGEGKPCGEQALPWGTELIMIDDEGGVWLSEAHGRELLHLDPDLNLLARSPELDDFSHIFDLALSQDGKTVFLPIYQNGCWLLNQEDLSFQRKRIHREVWGEPAIDAEGRFWAGVSDSALEGYDRDLQTVSRHRLKGSITHLCCNGEGTLMAYTHDRKRRILRVYRIS